MRRHAHLIEDWAPRVRLTAVSAEEAARRQYAESLELLRIAELHEPTEMLADVGSGGGFPGLVVAAVRPSMAVHLVEPLKKRARFLEEAAGELALANVTVHAVRAEEAGRGPLRDASGLVTGRAVAALRQLLEYTAPLAAPEGLIALPKGSAVLEEVAGAQRGLAALNCEVAGIERMRAEISDTISVVLLRKAGATPDQFPRRSGMAAKRPL